jgi:hypothetical protein
MPWYKAGTVSVALNSNAVTGTGTSFIANSRVGDAFLGPDGRWYEVTNIASNTAMSISPNYLGANASAGSYALAPMQGYVKDSADALRSLVNQFGTKLAALGTTGNYDTLPLNKGGTGATDQAGARAALALGSVATENVVPLNKGGTGATDQIGARNAIGLGSASVRNIDTSGANVPLLSNANSWSASQTLANGSLVGSTGVAPGAAVFQVMSSQGRLILTQGTGVNQIQSVNPANSGYLPFGIVCTNFYNDIDNGANLGNGQRRWATIFAVSGTINTSDAREKTAVSAMKDAEIQASIALAKEIGTFKWLASILEKGDEARTHVGMTVQRAIEIMTSFGLDAMAYAFICYDEWPAVDEVGYESIRGNIYSLGEMIYQNVEISMFEQYEDYSSFTWEETSRQYVITKKAEPAGNRYGFRYDQLALFIARGQEERLARLEALMTPAA